jgi:hypothetical protein
MMRLSATFTRRAVASSALIVADGAEADAVGNGIGRFGNKLLSTAAVGVMTGAGLATGMAAGSSSQFNIMSSPNSFLTAIIF